MSYDRVLNFSKWWGLKTYVEYFDRYQNVFLIQPLLLKGLHKYTLNICELFWDVKMEIGLFGKIQKIETQNGHAFYTTTVIYVCLWIYQYKIQRVKCLLGYSKIKISNIGWEICVPVLWCLQMRAHVEKWTSWAGTRIYDPTEKVPGSIPGKCKDVKLFQKYYEWFLYII